MKLEKTIEEKAKKAAFKKATRTALIILTPLFIFGCAIAVSPAVPPGTTGLTLFVIWGIVLLLAYEHYYEEYRKKFSEEVERKET